MTDVLRFAILGLGVGSLYALVSQGLIVIYRASGVLNLAQGAMGMAGAYMFYELRVVGDQGFPIALLAGAAFAGAIGALTEILIMRRLRRASALSRIVATLGFLIALQAIAVVRYGGEGSTVVPPDLPTSNVDLLGVTTSVDRLILIGIAAAVTLALHAIYRHTRLGLATTAVAENERSASAVGLSPAAVATTNWALGGALGGVAAILVAPIISLQPSSMTTLMLAALAAALVANFTSFGLALAASLALGVGQSELGRYVDNSAWATSLPFFVIVAMVLLRGRSLPLRDFFLQRLPALGTGRTRWPVVVVSIAAGAALISLLNPAWNAALATSLATAVIVLSVVVLTGYTGQLSLAQFALAGFGAWIAGRLVATQGLGFLPASAIGVALTVPVGVAFALPAVRARGIQLAVVTLGLGSAIEALIFNDSKLVGGYEGTMVGSPHLLGLNVAQFEHPERYALLCLGCYAVLALMVASVRRGRVGRRLIAVRTNERAAAALGISVWESKLYAFALAAAIAAVGGILLAFQIFVIDFARTFSLLNSITVVAYAFIGGIGFLAGPLVGSTLAPGGVGAQFSNDVLSGLSDYLGLIAGASLVLMVLQNQDGVAKETISQARWIAAQVRRAIPRRRASSPKPAQRMELPPATAIQAVPRTLVVEGLSVRYNAVVAVDDLSMTVRPGQIVGLIGPNGAGKTTAIDALSGFTKAHAGTVTLDGEDITSRSPVQRARRGLSRSFQSLELFEDSTVLDNLRAAFDPRDRLAYVTDLFYPRTPPIPEHVVAAVKEFGLEDDLLRTVSDLPYGRRRLVAIVRAIASNPSVLLLDEPAAGLSDAETTKLAEVVRRVTVDWGIAVLLVEHDMSFVMEVCDSIVVLDFGRTIATGTAGEVRSDERVVAVYLGEDEPDVSNGHTSRSGDFAALASQEVRDER